jgi:hypothetical protein
MLPGGVGGAILILVGVQVGTPLLHVLIPILTVHAVVLIIFLLDGAKGLTRRGLRPLAAVTKELEDVTAIATGTEAWEVILGVGVVLRWLASSVRTLSLGIIVRALVSTSEWPLLGLGLPLGLFPLRLKVPNRLARLLPSSPVMLVGVQDVCKVILALLVVGIVVVVLIRVLGWCLTPRCTSSAPLFLRMVATTST